MTRISLTGDRRARRQLLMGVALVAPILLVVAGRFALGLKPAESQAAMSAVTAAEELPAVQPMNAAQRKLVTYLSVTAGSLPPLNSPMDHIPAPLVPAPVAAAPVPTSVETVTPTAVLARPDTPLVLSGIMAGSDPDSALVMISGKVYRRGAVVTPGWTLTKIDAIALTITLRGTDNQEFTLARDPR